VVAKRRVALSALELIEDAGALLRCALEDPARYWRTGDKITCQEDRIGIQPVDAVDSIVKKEWLSEFVQVDVAELRHAEAVKCPGKAAKEDVVIGDLDPMPLDLAGIERQTGAGARACDQEAAARDSLLGRKLQQYLILSYLFST
jgi:hypothetical protein